MKCIKFSPIDARAKGLRNIIEVLRFLVCVKIVVTGDFTCDESQWVLGAWLCVCVGACCFAGGGSVVARLQGCMLVGGSKCVSGCG